MLKVDIEKFFDRIPRAQIKSLIKKHVRSSAISSLLIAAIDSEIEAVGGEAASTLLASGIRVGLGLRQGMPVSPLLSNLLLRDFDRALTATGLHAIRYADDIAVFAGSKLECEAALSLIQEQLRPLELRVPSLIESAKTAIYGPSESAEFLGIELRRVQSGYDICAPMWKIPAISDKMQKIASMESCIRNRETLPQVLRSLDALIVGYKSALSVVHDPSQFFARVEAEKRRHITALLTEIFGPEVVKGLNAEQLALLGLGPF